MPCGYKGSSISPTNFDKLTGFYDIAIIGILSKRGTRDGMKRIISFVGTVLVITILMAVTTPGLLKDVRLGLI